LRFVFDEQKAGESAAHLLQAAGGSMPYIKLIKLMYLADRHCLIESGFPITGDHMVSMPKGPVLSSVLERISHGPRDEVASPWFNFVSEPEHYDVNLMNPPPQEGRLSDYQISVLMDVFGKYGHMDKWALVDLTHKLPEWQDPHGSSLPIHPETIWRAVGKSDEEIKDRAGEAESVWFMEADADGWILVP
jgi:uncharacterized phage-associated protein